jgi:hypothetical protein
MSEPAHWPGRFLTIDRKDDYSMVSMLPAVRFGELAGLSLVRGRR